MTMSTQIYYESTPNPQAMKFIFDRELTKTPRNYQNAGEATDSPLALKIFGFPWASGVYIGSHFVTILKQDWVEWEILADPLAGLLQEHLESGEPILIEVAPKVEVADIDLSNAPIEDRIKFVIDREIRPAVAVDGGDIVFQRFENNVVYLHMQGSCAGCPSSTYTLKMGIENRLKELFSEIQEVVSV